jgi:hypothetical protein
MAEERKPDPEDFEADLGPDDDVGGDGGEGTRSFVTDAVRKAFLAGVGAIFLTEEGARRLAREWKLPKEVLGFVTSQAAGAKDEVLRVVSEEVRKFFQSESLRREFLKVLGSMSIEVNAEIRLKESGGKAKPHVQRALVKPKLGRDPSAPEHEE